VSSPSPIRNRVEPVMSHCSYYLDKGVSRLAADTGFSRSTISRLLAGNLSPSFALACAVTKALRRRLGVKVELFDLFSVDGKYPKPSACDAVRCPGCFLRKAFPPDAVDSNVKTPSQTNQPKEDL